MEKESNSQVRREHRNVIVGSFVSTPTTPLICHIAQVAVLPIVTHLLSLVGLASSNDLSQNREVRLHQSSLPGGSVGGEQHLQAIFSHAYGLKTNPTYGRLQA